MRKVANDFRLSTYNHTVLFRKSMIPYKLLGPYISVLKNQAIFHQQKPGKAGNGQGLCDRGGNNTKLKETSSKDFRHSDKIKDSF